MAQPDKTQFSASTESWVNQIVNALHSPHQMWQVSKNVCIYMVPEAIKIFKSEAYVPQIVSFGPYHHKINSELSKMGRHKLEAVSRMLSRLKIDITTLIGQIQKLECEIRECYDEPINLDRRALIWMLAMDACFILQFFKGEDNSHRIFLTANEKNPMYNAIVGDILKLENQIPLFILIKLLQLECGTREKATEKLAAMLSKHRVFSGFPFQFSLDGNAELQLKQYMMDERPPHHLLDLYRMVIKNLLTDSSAGSASPVERDGYGGACSDWQFTPNAELLEKAGIKFQPGKLGFQKKRFGTSMLFIPQITIENSTESLLQNLIVYEDCHSCLDTVISHFVRLLNNLIDSKKDVSVLKKSRVLQSFLGRDEDIARMFNRLCAGITLGSIEKFDKVMKEATDHYKGSKCKLLLSGFKEDHCSNRWHILLLVVMILILGMMAVKTVYSVKN